MKRNKKGFTMVEVLAAVALLGAVTVGVLQLFTYGNTVPKVNEEMFTVNYLMQRRVEEIKAEPFSHDASGLYFYPGYPGYQFTVTQQVPYLSSVNLKRIQVYLNWTNTYGVVKQKVFFFLMANI